MTVDSFKYLPRIIGAIYEMTDRKPLLPIPWTPLRYPLDECKFSIITTGGVFQSSIEPPFDLEREKREPSWGDPTYRTIQTSIRPEEIGVSHLHVNTSRVEEDLNVLLPINRFQELVKQGRIGGLADHVYSFMGYQGHPADTSEWQEIYAPQVAEKLHSEGVHCLLITPS